MKNIKIGTSFPRVSDEDIMYVGDYCSEIIKDDPGNMAATVTVALCLDLLEAAQERSVKNHQPRDEERLAEIIAETFELEAAMKNMKYSRNKNTLKMLLDVYKGRITENFA